MSLNSIEHHIIKHMARTMFVTAWADYQEQVLKRAIRGDAMELAPETPDYVLADAYYQAGRLAQANDTSIFHLFRTAIVNDDADPNKWQNSMKLQHEFAYGMIMPMMGHGVSWFDSHTRFALVKPDFEWSYLDLNSTEYPDPEDT